MIIKDDLKSNQKSKMAVKTKNNKAVYCKITGKERLSLTQDHPMFCCANFQDWVISDLRIAIAYNPRYRLYYYIEPKQCSGTYPLRYCPSCGKQWPPHLMDEYFDELEKVMGHEIVYIEFDWTTLPEEFKSEEWWRKRGL